MDLLAPERDLPTDGLAIAVLTSAPPLSRILLSPLADRASSHAYAFERVRGLRWDSPHPFVCVDPFEPSSPQSATAHERGFGGREQYNSQQASVRVALNSLPPPDVAFLPPRPTA